MKNMLIPKDQIKQFYTSTLSDDYREKYIQLLDEVKYIKSTEIIFHATNTGQIP